nr:sigma-54 dependent transcriptional regulator [uncultured Glaciecola sp.]
MTLKSEEELNYVLIADDNKDMCDLLAYLLGNAGYKTQQVQDGDAVISLLTKCEPSLLLLDNIMPGTTGMEILAYTNLYFPRLPVIMITGNGGIFGAVSAMKAGASDYLAKPFDNARVLDLVNKFSNIRNQLTSGGSTKCEPQKTTSLRIANFMGDSEEIRVMTRNILLVAPTNLSVIIQGESGTGKELVAKNIHQASLRAAQAFTPIDCGSISDALIENELFGHEKGAYTGADRTYVGKIESSEGGTLFLDEIINMSLSAQAKLLRVIQERVIYRVGSTAPIPVNIRILVASNENLLDAVVKGKFREDLFYRLNEFTIHITPLRYRPADMLFLANRFKVEASIEMSKSVPSLSNLAINELQRYAWPGNVRQLRSTMRRATLMAGSQIDVSDLDFPADGNNNELVLKQDGVQQITLNTASDCIAYMATLAPENLSLKSMKIMFSEEVIKNTLKVTNNNKSETARRLSIDYKTLLLKIKSFTTEE